LISRKTQIESPHRKRPLKLGRLFASAALAISSAAAPLTFAVIATQTAQAQNFGQRIIQGKVLENDDHAGGATVFLKNLKTRDIKSYTSTPDGSFRFGQVGMVDDYEVWAERGKKKSAVKTVSSFDSRKQLDLELKLK
jgi:hypothetical protein